MQMLARAPRPRMSVSMARQSVVAAEVRLGVFGKARPAQVAAPTLVAAPTHEAIAARAEEIWRQQGCPAGKDTGIWLLAEAHLKAESRARSAATAGRP